MMDLTKWLRLYKIDPELKPPGLEPLLVQGCLAGWTFGGEFFENGGVWHCPPVVLPQVAAAAMIRDRAVWWLAGRGYEVILTNEVNDNDEPFMGLCLKTAESLVGFSCTDPTEALYLAWCKVLGVEP